MKEEEIQEIIKQILPPKIDTSSWKFMPVDGEEIKELQFNMAVNRTIDNWEEMLRYLIPIVYKKLNTLPF